MQQPADRTGCASRPLGRDESFWPALVNFIRFCRELGYGEIIHYQHWR